MAARRLLPARKKRRRPDQAFSLPCKFEPVLSRPQSMLGVRTPNWTLACPERSPMYPPNKKREALDLWFATCGEFSIAEFTAQLGYPDSGDAAVDHPAGRPGQVPLQQRPRSSRRSGAVAGGEHVPRPPGPSGRAAVASVDVHARGSAPPCPRRRGSRRGEEAAGRAGDHQSGRSCRTTPAAGPSSGQLEFDNAVPREVLAPSSSNPRRSRRDVRRDQDSRPGPGLPAAAVALRRWAWRRPSAA